MSTLYELLGALPHDDAEELRTAFRKAVKGAHPDLRPDDPDAALKFREIVRANEILCDPEQRQAYDHLLDLARLEEQVASQQVPAVKMRKFSSAAAMAFAGASAMVVGVYLLFIHVSSSGAVTAANNIENGITASLVAASADFVTAHLPGKAVPRTSTLPTPQQQGPRLDLIANGEDVESMQAPQFNRDGDFTMAHLNPALQPAVVFYRLQKVDGAFSILPAKSIEKPRSLKPVPKIARRKFRDHPSFLPSRFSIFQTRTAIHDTSREKRVAQIR